MNKLKIGFSRVDVTPMLGIHISGYFKTRLADGVLDNLEVSTVSFECDGKKAVMVSIPNCGINRGCIKEFAEHINAVTGLAREQILIHTTHTHTGPTVTAVVGEEIGELEIEYKKTLMRKIADSVKMALDDLSPAKMGFGKGVAPNVSFVRRFRMKDGSLQTNPGVNNPDIVAPVGDIDDSVNVVRFDRECGDSVVIVNFANHPDVVGGNKISADWPGLLTHEVEHTLPNTKCAFFNGAQGDVNHVNVHPTGGYLNDMFMDFDDVARGYKHAKYIARVVLGGVLQAFDKVEYVDVDSINYLQNTINLPSNRPTPEELPEAERINALHLAGKDSELPYKGMMLTTVVAEAGRMVRLKDGPDAFDMELSGLRIGPVAFVGIPGEPFNGIGKGIKAVGTHKMILPMCLTNGSEGYFPMQDAYDEGGYEARSSNFKSGVAEFIIKHCTELLKELGE